jgi:hypothetical protein
LKEQATVALFELAHYKEHLKAVTAAIPSLVQVLREGTKFGKRNAAGALRYLARDRRAAKAISK